MKTKRQTKKHRTNTCKAAGFVAAGALYLRLGLWVYTFPWQDEGRSIIMPLENNPAHFHRRQGGQDVVVNEPAEQSAAHRRPEGVRPGPMMGPSSTFSASACAYSGHYPLYCEEADASAASPVQSSSRVKFWDETLPPLFMPEGLPESSTYRGNFDATAGPNSASLPLPCHCVPDPKAHASYESDNALRKNVLFVVVDDLRMQLGHLDEDEGDNSGNTGGGLAFDFMYTPNIDDFAVNASMRFSKAYVQAAVCAVSRTSVLTGRRPDTTLVHDLETYWRTSGCPTCNTLPQQFINAGYENVVGMGKIFHGGSSSNHHDQDYSWTKPYGTAGARYHYDGTPLKAVTEAEEEAQQLDDTLIVNEALQHLVNFEGDGAAAGPWFVAVGLKKPHLPFACPARFFRQYSQPDLPIADNDYVCPDDPDHPFPSDAHASLELQKYDDAFVAELDDGGTVTLMNSSEFHPGTKGCHWRIPDDRTRELTRAYHACVSHADDELGRLFRGVKDSGFWDTTVIVLWSDHGFKLGEHHAFTKHSNFDIDTHVPFFVRVPGAAGLRSRYDAPVEAIDLFATTVEAAGLESVPSCSFDPAASGATALCTEGRSLMPLLRGEESSPPPPPRPAVSQYQRGKYRMGYTMVLPDGTQRFTAWVDWADNKTTWTPQHESNGGIAFEWYNHTQDPKEKYNLAQNKLDPTVLALFDTLKGRFPQRPTVSPTPRPTVSAKPTFESGTVVQIVNFDAAAVSSKDLSYDAFPFNDNTPTTNVAGQPVYGGFSPLHSSDGRIWAVTPEAKGGLKLRWATGKGVKGEEMSGLFLWKQHDFLNGMDVGTVNMNLTTNVAFTVAGFSSSKASAMLRLVIKDEYGFHISEAFDMTSRSTLEVTPGNFSYQEYNPYTNSDATTVGTIGIASGPSLSGVEWVGFRMDAHGGVDVVNGVSIPVAAFSVSAFK